MPFILDGYPFPNGEEPARGPVIEHKRQRWARHAVIGVGEPGTVMTLMGTDSESWPFFVARASAATKDKLVAVNDGGIAVLFVTPQNATGFNVVLDDLQIEHSAPEAQSKFRCSFTLTKR